jgi:hypothetical protein
MYRDPSVSDAPIFTKVCSFTDDEDKRYGDAYDQLRRMLDRELLQHIADESDRFRNVLKDIAHDLQANRIGVFDEDAWDELRGSGSSPIVQIPGRRPRTFRHHRHRRSWSWQSPEARPPMKWGSRRCRCVHT